MNTARIEKVVADGEPDLVGALARRRVVVFAHLHVSHDVLAHHDRVVDQDADRQREPEQRHRLQLEPHHPHGDEARQHRHRQRQTGDDRRAPGVQEEEDDEHRQHRALEQRLLDVTHRVVDTDTRVLHQLELRPLAERRLELLHPCANLVGDVGSAVALCLLDVDADGFLVVEQRERPRLLGPVAHVGDLAQADHLAVALGDDELRELLRVLEPALEPDRPFVHVAHHATHRRGEVLELERLHHLPDTHPGGLHLLRLELHRELALHLAAHRHLGHAGNRAQLAGDRRIGEAGQLTLRQRRRRQRHRHDRTVRIVELLDDRLLHLHRQVGALGRDGVAQILRRLHQVLAELELHHDEAVAVVRVAVDVLHPTDRRDLLLDRVEDLLLYPFRRRAGIRDPHRHHRRGDVGKLVGLELEQREQAEHHQRHHGDDGDERLLDREIGDEHGMPVRSTDLRSFWSTVRR